MPTKKLTLSADRQLIAEAKRVAKRAGTSLSSMFARFLEAVLRGRSAEGKPGPVTRKASGLGKLPANKTDRRLLEESLAEKYRSTR